MIIEKSQFVTKVFGAHCHERVYIALELYGPATKETLATCANTTPAVVANAIHDWKRGKYTRTNVPVFPVVTREKVGNSNVAVYALPAPSAQLELELPTA